MHSYCLSGYIANHVHMQEAELCNIAASLEMEEVQLTGESDMSRAQT